MLKNYLQNKYIKYNKIYKKNILMKIYENR